MSRASSSPNFTATTRRPGPFAHPPPLDHLPRLLPRGHCGRYFRDQHKAELAERLYSAAERSGAQMVTPIRLRNALRTKLVARDPQSATSSIRGHAVYRPAAGLPTTSLPAAGSPVGPTALHPPCLSLIFSLHPARILRSLALYDRVRGALHRRCGSAHRIPRPTTRAMSMCAGIRVSTLYCFRAPLLTETNHHTRTAPQTICIESAVLFPHVSVSLPSV